MTDDAICTCTHVPGYHQHPEVDVEFYVCGACDKPTRLYLESAFERIAKEHR